MSFNLSEIHHTSSNEHFMTPSQIECFRKRLIKWRGELLEKSCETRKSLQEEKKIEADLVDYVANEIDINITLQLRDRERKLIRKIEDSLRRIEDGSYGYCEETGLPIQIKRLEKFPTCTLSFEAQKRLERRNRLNTAF